MGQISSIYSVVKSPLVTEKALKDTLIRKYVFLVNNNANKIEIKTAVEKIYKVKVDRISSVVVKGKMKRLRANQPGLTNDWKKAIVTLKEGFEIKTT